MEAKRTTELNWNFISKGVFFLKVRAKHSLSSDYLLSLCRHRCSTRL